MVVIVGAADGLRYVVEKVDGAEKRLRDPSAGSIPHSQREPLRGCTSGGLFTRSVFGEPLLA